jgi:hypothetical protein
MPIDAHRLSALRATPPHLRERQLRRRGMERGADDQSSASSAVRGLSLRRRMRQ